jgi:hypothetical protein
VTISEQTDAERLKAMRAALPSADTVPAEAFMLAEAVRDLVEATVMTDVSPAERAAVAAELSVRTRCGSSATAATTGSTSPTPAPGG